MFYVPPFLKNSLSLARTGICDQAKAPYVCDVNISPAEKHLFITRSPYPVKSPSQGNEGQQVPKKLFGLARQVSGATPHGHEPASPPYIPVSKFQAVKGSWSHRGEP